VFTSIYTKYGQARKLIAVLSVASLTLSALSGLSAPANASTAFEITFGGNRVGTSVPADQTQTRGVAFALPSESEVTGTRTGYTFGGWSLEVGGPALVSPYTYNGAATIDNNRLNLFAVWNTTIAYNFNGQDSGSLTGSKTNDTYRFGNTFTLPTSGTLVKSGYAFGGWMAASISTNRSTSYLASSDAVGNPTLFAAWIKTVSFNANGAASGTVPTNLIYLSAGERLKLPVLSEMTLRKPGYEFMGWSSTATGTVVSTPTSYVPIISNQTLYAIWKIKITQASTRVFFEVGESRLRAGQKLIVRDLVDTLRGKTTISIKVNATRPKTAIEKLGKARNTSVVQYLRSLGVVAVFERQNKAGAGKKETAKKNNRVTVMATWSNPA
jgi:uncharacterized repeat protein (TIGR02543 family)